MEAIIEKSRAKINKVDTSFVRELSQINWDARMIGIKGARGVGKTTLLLQHLKNYYPNDDTAVYISLDNIWFAANKLNDFIDNFVKMGGKRLFIDEIHKYPNWAQILKNAYDDHAELYIVFTGSSMLEILNSRTDLSRRAVVYYMQGLSFREFLNYNYNLSITKYYLEDIIEHHQQIAEEVSLMIKPLKEFQQYVQRGYYPFYSELPDLYYYKIEAVLNMILEIELPLMKNLEVRYVSKLKQMLQIIAESVPFVPNVSKLSERVGINRATFLSYLHYFAESKLTINVFKDATGISKLQKPDKIYLENTNLIYALSSKNANIGNLRETFFVNQLSYQNTVEYAAKADFIVNKKYTFEIGGKTKTKYQISNISDSFIVSDDIEIGTGNRIPLWLFGLLY